MLLEKVEVFFLLLLLVPVVPSGAPLYVTSTTDMLGNKHSTYSILCT